MISARAHRARGRAKLSRAVGFLRGVPCVQIGVSAKVDRPTHALERQPAQAVLRADLGTLSPAENVASVHARKPESSRRRRSSSRPPSTAFGGRDPRGPRVEPRGAAAPHATPAESAGATERLLRPPGWVIIGLLDGAAEHGPRRRMDQDDDPRHEVALRDARRAAAGRRAAPSDSLKGVGRTISNETVKRP